MQHRNSFRATFNKQMEEETREPPEKRMKLCSHPESPVQRTDLEHSSCVPSIHAPDDKTKKCVDEEHCKFVRKMRRIQSMLPARTLKFVQHDDHLYAEREDLYSIVTSIPNYCNWSVEPQCMIPSAEHPVVIPLIPNIPLQDIWGEELIHLSGDNEWDDSLPKPILSVDLIRKFLAIVHSFTAVGLETQATAFSCGRNDVIKYLGILPQINETHTVTSAEDGPTDFDLMDGFKMKDPITVNATFFGRCWIHTHPRWKAFMSTLDIVQLYYNERMCGHSFGIVLSPRREGAKALCVALTREGKAHIDHLREEACKSKIDPRNHIISHLRDDIKYYYQIPFITSSEPSIVVDLRSSDEVAGRLMQFILSGKADKCWNPLVVSEKDE